MELPGSTLRLNAMKITENEKIFELTCLWGKYLAVKVFYIILKQSGIMKAGPVYSLVHHDSESTLYI